MRDDVLHRTIEQTFSYVRRFEQGRVVSFVWHGGEATLAKRAFYDKALQYQAKYAEDVRCENSIQANGTLIDDSWLEFFKLANFRAGFADDERHVVPGIVGRLVAAEASAMLGDDRAVLPDYDPVGIGMELRPSRGNLIPPWWHSGPGSSRTNTPG